MDSHQDEEEMKQESSGDETRSLVTALTQQLLVDDRAGASRVELAPVVHEEALPRLNSTSTGILLFNDQIFCPPTSGTDERDLSVLPEFLSDASIKAALHRANALRPQGHLSDEPQFPSSLGGDRPRHLDARDQEAREVVGSRDLLPLTLGAEILLPLTRTLILLPRNGLGFLPTKALAFQKGLCQGTNLSLC
jgi:hypothetical protein